MLYRTLDYLTDSKQEIEKELYYRLQCYGLETEFVLNDITSSYFEGDDAEFGEYGYSQNHRSDRPQIVMGVVTSKEGIPFAHYVFKGNTADKSTVSDVLQDLKERFGITHCIFVGDRGMVTRINLDYIKGHEYDYIMDIRRRDSRIVREPLPFIQQNPQQEIIQVHQEQFVDQKLKQELSPKTRFVIGFNKDVRDQVRQNRKSKYVQFQSFLETLPIEGGLKEITDRKTKVISYLTRKRIK